MKIADETVLPAQGMYLRVTSVAAGREERRRKEVRKAKQVESPGGAGNAAERKFWRLISTS